MIHNSSYTFYSKVHKIIKRILSVSLTVISLFIAISILNRVYWEEELWNHILWNSFYDQDNIDNIFIGSSHVYCGINPFMMDEINGKNNFNLAVRNLTLSGSYYLLKEADRLYYFPNSGLNCVSSKWAVNNEMRIIPYLKNSLVKCEYILKTLDTSYYLEALVPFVRCRSKLFDSEYIKKVKELKDSEDWNEYKRIVQDGQFVSQYMEKGYNRSNYTMESENAFFYETPLDLETQGLLTDDNSEYMVKIIDYCRINGISLKFFIAPIYETQILSSVDYDGYYQQVSSIARNNGVELYDFNLCKTEYLDIMHPQYFRDNGHLNENGANMFTPFLWKIISDTYANNKKYFCNTYEEKISLDEPELYGIYWKESDEGKICTFASNTESDLQYSLLFVPEVGDNIVIHGFSLKNNLLFPMM